MTVVKDYDAHPIYMCYGTQTEVLDELNTRGLTVDLVKFVNVADNVIAAYWNG